MINKKTYKNKFHLNRPRFKAVWNRQKYSGKPPFVQSSIHVHRYGSSCCFYRFNGIKVQKNTVFPFLFFEYAPACNAISLKYYLEGWQGHKMHVVLVLVQYMSV